MQRWNPWRALRSRPHITLRFDPIARQGGGGIYYRRGDQAVIVLDPALSRRDRRSLLAHELVHDERGGGCEWGGMPFEWLVVVNREEHRVSKITADRLIPRGELLGLLRRCETVGEEVTARFVALEFDVADWAARIALADLVPDELEETG